MQYFQAQSKKGFALLLAVIITSIVLAIGLSILHITMKRVDLGVTAFGSETSFQTAASAADCLLYLGRVHRAEFLSQASSIPIDCLGQTGKVLSAATKISTVNEKVTEYKYTGASGGLDWTPAAGQDYCFALDVYVYNASAMTSGQLAYTIADHGVTHTCNAGDVCTYGFARGFNVACNSLGGLDVYQRELSVNF